MTTFNRNYRTAATLAAVVIVGLTGLTLDRGHAGALPHRQPRSAAGRRRSERCRRAGLRPSRP